MSAHKENRCPPTRRTIVRQQGENLSAHKEFSLSLDSVQTERRGATPLFAREIGGFISRCCYGHPSVGG
jgi:hypothetical protein